ncbi:hypothetical protein BRD13_03085 [Halobacteriales archaeon SW_5_70_135]|nr:MAG: hypothetical protein BRD13_03085 [Halobacteriales archaeon SW_5_70_135]
MTELRDKDQTVLHQIHSGNNDIQQITEATTLSNRKVNYCFQKLEQQGLIDVHKPDGMVKRVIDGQKRVFEHPKQAELTKQGRKHLSEEQPDQYREMSYEELVERVHNLEAEVEELRESLKTFREQVRSQL